MNSPRYSYTTVAVTSFHWESGLLNFTIHHLTVPEARSFTKSGCWQGCSPCRSSREAVSLLLSAWEPPFHLQNEQSIALWPVSIVTSVIDPLDFLFSPIESLVTWSCLTLCNPMDWWLTRLLCSWDFPGKSTGVDCHFLLLGIFLTQGLNPFFCIAGRFFTIWATKKAPLCISPWAHPDYLG